MSCTFGRHHTKRGALQQEVSEKRITQIPSATYPNATQQLISAFPALFYLSKVPADFRVVESGE
jgi:hypothetical protein